MRTKKVQNHLLYVDECVDKFTEDKIISDGYIIHSIRRYHQGIKDSEVERMVLENDGVLLSKDKDFNSCDYSVVYSGRHIKNDKYEQIIRKMCE